MELNHIDMVRFQPAQTLLDVCFQYSGVPVERFVLIGEAKRAPQLPVSAHQKSGGIESGREKPATFREEEKLIAAGAQCPTELFLAIPVHRGSVDDVYAGVRGDAEQLVHGSVGYGCKTDRTIAKTQNPNLKASVAEAALSDHGPHSHSC